MEFPFKARVKSKKEVAKGTLEVTFEVPEDVTFKAGQYFFVNLINPPYSDARGTKRHFSIVNSPNQKGELVITTRLRDSAFKKSLQELKVKDEVEVGPISGDFILPKESDRPLVFIAGGIGITPFMSMVRFASEEKLPRKITLIYSNRDKDSTAYFNDLQNLERENPNLKVIFTMTEDPNWQGEKRRVDADFIKSYFEEPNSYIYYMAGPPPMVEAVYAELQKADVESGNIKTENFSGY